MSNEINNLYEFGGFRLDPETSTLWRENELIPLSPKAFELLFLLVRRHGEIVSKQEIFETVWAGTFVEEGVLTQNIYTLRQTLGLNEKGKPFIENIARRGYRLSIPIDPFERSAAELSTLGANSREFVIATETRTEIIEEFVEDERAPKLISSGKKPFYRRKSAAFFSGGLILVLLAGFFGYRYFRPRAWIYFHPPLENVEFLKLTDSGSVTSAAISPDGNFLAFIKSRGVFLKDIKSGKDIRLEIPNIQSFNSLAFSAAGDSIYFRNNEVPRRIANIYEVSRFGGEARLVAEKTWLGFGVAPDGQKIAFLRNFPDRQKQTLFVKNLANGEEREVLTKNFPDYFFFKSSLAWSPDAKKIAFVINAGTERATRLFVLDTETGREEEIKSPRLRHFEQVAWLPDGETLVASASELGRTFHLWKINYPNGDAQRITNGLSSFETVSVSQDGKKIVAMQLTENSNLWISDAADLNNPKPVTSGNSNNVGQTSLNWAGNDRLIYAASDEKNPFANLWALNVADNSRQPLTTNTDFHSDFATVTGDGQTVFFNANRNRLINVWRIDTSGENLAQVTKAGDGLQLYPAISPDGRFLYYLFRNREASVIKRVDLAQNTEEIFVGGENISPAAFLSLSADGKYLAFLNMRAEAETDEAESSFQFAVVSTDRPTDVKFFKVKGFGTFARLSADGRFLDYAAAVEGSTKIMRQSVAGGEPTAIFTLPDERIFNFAWTRDGGKLAVSRGHQYHDAILLTGFE